MRKVVATNTEVRCKSVKRDLVYRQTRPTNTGTPVRTQRKQKKKGTRKKGGGKGGKRWKKGGGKGTCQEVAPAVFLRHGGRRERNCDDLFHRPLQEVKGQSAHTEGERQRRHTHHIQPRTHRRSKQGTHEGAEACVDHISVK